MESHGHNSSQIGRRTILGGGGLIVGSMVLAACGDDDQAVAAPATGTPALTSNEYVTVDPAAAMPIPEPLQTLFENPDLAKVQKLPIALPGVESKAIFFEAGGRTVPHRHADGQHIIITSGTGVFGDRNGVHIVKTGDVIANPATEWHWHGALPSEAMTHVTVENPGLDLNVDRGDYDEVYTEDLGK